MISQTSIDRIRDLDIKSVIEKFLTTELKKNGTGWKAKSPFNEENTPSFYIVPHKNIFKDFSSGYGGDAIKFVMLHEKCEFIEAIEKIAAATGERLEYERPATDEENEKHELATKLFKINQAAANKFFEQLIDVDHKHLAYKDLIDKRRFSDNSILQWQIGYAPDQWKFLTSILHEKGLIGEGKTLDLVKEKDGNFYDTFRNRVMYPIFNANGQVVTFGGRLLEGEGAKYLNGAESPIYQKSKILYGLNFAGTAIRKYQYANLVEGYTDVISFHQAGFINTVGTCGTALSDDQCKLLKRYCSKAVLFPDQDVNGAGERSALRSIDVLLSHGFEVQVVSMPVVEGKKVDPDELVRMCDTINESN